MSSLILCNKKRAKQPYEVSRIHCRIYTLEELCYYLSNNLYLIDYTIVNERLCDWIEAELGLLRLAEQLRTMLQKHSSEERFVMRIFVELFDLYSGRTAADPKYFGPVEKSKRN